MKVAIITDQHIGVRNSNVIFLDYFERFYREIFFPYLKKEGITTILNGGDTLDNRKTTNIMTMDRFASMWMNPIVSGGMKEHAIIGNHNSYFRNTNKINSLNALYRGRKAFDLVETHPKEIEIDGRIIGLVPWICSENRQECFDFIKTTRATVLLGHFEISGFYMDGNMKCEDGLSISEFNRFERVFSGHFHKKQTVANITYLGTPYDISFNDLGEQKGFHVFDTDTLDLDFVPNPHKLFHKIYYDDVINDYDLEDDDFSDLKNCFVRIVVLNKKKPAIFDEFIQKLQNSEVYKISILEKNHDLSESGNESEKVDMALPTIDIIVQEINKMDDLVDAAEKEQLKQIMIKLYTEAINQ